MENNLSEQWSLAVEVALGRMPDSWVPVDAQVILAVQRKLERDAVLQDVLRSWMTFSSDVVPGCAAGYEELEMLRARTERLLTRAIAPEITELVSQQGKPLTNVHLIEAAPDLLASLEELQELDFGANVKSDANKKRMNAAALRARAAIKKARGVQ
jgi:hypothetical protein